MTKGHNKGEYKEHELKEKTKGQHEHLPDKKKNKSPHQGRNADPDPSDGRKKGPNAI